MLSLAYALDYAISTGLKRMDDYRFQTWKDISNSNINADVLIMGNSRAFSHFDPHVLDSVLKMNTYNLGIGGHSFNVQYLRYQYYIKHNRKPKIIIQNVDFFTFVTMKIGHQREQLFPFVFDPFLQKELLNFGYSWPELHLPVYRYFGYQMVVKNGLFEFLNIHHYKNQPSYKGFRPETGNWNPTVLNTLENFKSVSDSAALSLFDKFVSECKTENIKLVLVYSPVYYKAMEKFKNRKESDNLIDSLAKRHSLIYFNYAKDSICYKTDLFHVAIHLNKTGAKIFTKSFAEDLKMAIK